MRNYSLRVANGDIQTKENVQFHIYVRKVSDHPRQLPKKIVVLYVSTSPLNMVTIQARIESKVVSCLRIPGASQTENQDNEVRENVETMDNDDPITPTSAEDEIDLSGITDEELRSRVQAVLEGHKPMWDGQLGEIVATRHLIDLKPGSVPKHQMTYRQKLAMRDALYNEICQQIEAGVIEPSKNEWGRPVVLVIKKDW